MIELIANLNCYLIIFSQVPNFSKKLLIQQYKFSKYTKYKKDDRDILINFQ